MSEGLVRFNYKPLEAQAAPSADGQEPREIARGLLAPTDEGAETIKRLASEGGAIFLSEDQSLPFCSGCRHRDDTVGCGKLKTTFVRLWQRSGVTKAIIVSAHPQDTAGQSASSSSKPDDEAPCRSPHKDIPLHTS